MSDFTDEQELEIINSPDFAKFLKERQEAGSDRVDINDFLEIAGNQAKWEKRFAEQAQKQEKTKSDDFTNDEQLYNGFMETVDQAAHITDEKEKDEYIRGFIEKKNKYLSAKTSEERTAIEEQLTRFLNNQDDEKIFWSNDLLVVDEDFKDRFIRLNTNSKTIKEDINETITIDENDKDDVDEIKTHKERRSVPNMLMVVTDNREAGANHTQAELIAQLESINATEHNLAADRLKRMILAIKQSYRNLSNQDVLDSFASEEFGEIYTNVQNMPAEERTRRLESAGFRNFEAGINGENNTFARDRLLALYMLSNARNYPSTKYSLNDVIQNEADVAIGDYIAKNVYGYDDPVNPTSNGVREPYFTRDMEIDVIGPEPQPQPDPRPRPEPIPPHEDGFYRERSDNSDKNEEKLDKVKVVVLYEMGVISSDIMQAALKNPEKAMEAIARRDLLKEDRQQEFGTRLSEKLLSLDNAYTEVKDSNGNVVKDEQGNDVRIEVTFNDLPPQMLANLYSYIKDKKENIPDNAPDEEKQKITRDFNKVAERIDDVTNQYYSGTAMPIALQAYNYDTETNIADIYDGYTDMFKVRRPDVDEQRQAIIDGCQKKLDGEIEQYDDVYGLSSIKEGDATRLSDNADKLSKRMENMSLSPELLSQLGNLKFLDENGQAIPQFDTDGKILPDSKLQTLVDFAKNNARIEHIGDKNVSKDALSDKALQDNIDSRFYAVLRAAADEKDIFKTLDETQRNFKDDINTAALMAQLNDPNRPIEITPAEFEAIKQNQVNQTIACINRIDKKVGANGNNYLLPKLHEPIKKYDTRASERFSIADPNKPTVKNWFKTFGMTTVTSVGMKAVAWGGAKLAALGAAHTTGATSTFLGNIGMSQVAGFAAVGLTSFAMYKNIKNFKANNPGVSGWKAFTTAPYASQMLASGLGCAAGVCLMTNNYMGAAICGGAALTVLGVSEYRNARKLGLSKWDSFKRSAHKLSAVAAGAFTGNWLSQQFGMTPDSIKHGEKLEDAQPDKEYHNYSKEEHAHGDLRQGAAENHPNDPHTEGSRYSEYMDRDWTESSYAKDPQGIHETMQSNINNGIQGHSQFFTLGENGQEISNADMLEYKLYQLNLLAQNGDAATVNGSPVSEVFSVTDTNGNVTTYQDLYHNLQQPGYQMTTSDLELLGKIENGVGGQLGNGVNDMGKISIFGEVANKDGQVLSFVDKMDAGYDVVKVDGHEAVYAPDEVIKGENPSSVAYIGWVEKAKRKTLQLASAFADKINPFKRKKEDTVVPPSPEPRAKQEPQDNVNEMLDKEYQIIHGKKPSETERTRYKQLIQNEWQQESAAPADMGAYLQQRMDKFETMIGTAKEPLAESNQGMSDKYKNDINQARQQIQGEKGSENITLSGFGQRMSTYLSNKGQGGNTTGSKTPIVNNGPSTGRN